MPSMKNKWPVKQKRLGTTGIDSCNFELCSQGTVVYNYQFNGIQGWAMHLYQIKCLAII